jgi:ribonuclease HI
LALCDAQGNFIVDGGRVEIRYKATDAKAYRAAHGNLEFVAGELIPDGEVVAGEAVASGPRATKAKASTSTATSSLPDNALIAYTDGACTGNPGPAGLGVLLIDGDQRRELSKYLGHGTNNIAELSAVEEALLAAEDHGRALVIHTDSQYAIGVLTKGWKAKANQELIARIKVTLKPFVKLQLRYVKGHAGIPDNERVDELARAAVVARASSGWIKVR